MVQNKYKLKTESANQSKQKQNDRLDGYLIFAARVNNHVWREEEEKFKNRKSPKQIICFAKSQIICFAKSHDWLNHLVGRSIKVKINKQILHKQTFCDKMPFNTLDNVK